jgi:hypothetical protein
MEEKLEGSEAKMWLFIICLNTLEIHFHGLIQFIYLSQLIWKKFVSKIAFEVYMDFNL